MGWHHRLDAAWAASGSMLCVGLDPDPARLPASLASAPDGIARFCTAIVDATADLVCAFKPQFAHFASQRAEPALERVCAYIRDRYPNLTVVLDANLVAREWAQHGECGLVVGATFPAQLAAVREVAGELPILVPGIGAQG